LAKEEEEPLGEKKKAPLSTPGKKAGGEDPERVSRSMKSKCFDSGKVPKEKNLGHEVREWGRSGLKRSRKKEKEGSATWERRD